MSKSKIILTDADGVLLNWLSGFERFMKDLGYSVIPGSENEYSMHLRYPITSEEAGLLVRQFNEGSYIADLNPEKDVVGYVQKLVDHGFRFVCITSISANPVSLEYRRINLENIFGKIFDDIICLEMGSQKASTLQAWKDSGYFWIEDHIKNAEAGHKLGLKTILIQQDHNTHYSEAEFPIVGPENPWMQIYEIISKEYNLS